MLLGTLLSHFKSRLGQGFEFRQPQTQNPDATSSGTETSLMKKNKKDIRHSRLSRHRRVLRNVIAFMEKNFSRKISLEEVAGIVSYNRTYFSSLFKKNIGISFYDYLTRLRFRHALHRMNTARTAGSEAKTLTEIAADCGFPDLKTFSRYYQKHFHEPPHMFRPRGDELFLPSPPLSGGVQRPYIASENPEIDGKLRSYIDEPPQAAVEAQPAFEPQAAVEAQPALSPQQWQKFKPQPKIINEDLQSHFSSKMIYNKFGANSLRR